MNSLTNPELNSQVDPEPDDDPITPCQPGDISHISMAHACFLDAMGRRIREHFEPTDMPADFIEKFIPVFTQSIDNALIKFAKGQREHGGDIRDRDLEADETQEIMDLFLYRAAKQTQNKVLQIRV